MRENSFRLHVCCIRHNCCLAFLQNSYFFNHSVENIVKRNMRSKRPFDRDRGLGLDLRMICLKGLTVGFCGGYEVAPWSLNPQEALAYKELCFRAKPSQYRFKPVHIWRMSAVSQLFFGTCFMFNNSFSNILENSNNMFSNSAKRFTAAWAAVGPGYLLL